MKVRFSKRFKKQLRELPVANQTKFYDRLTIFVNNPHDIRLRLHPLQGSLSGFWSINVSGDLRALFQHERDELVLFMLIGTHSQRY